MAIVSVAGLSGCNALRVAYNTGPTLAWWWLDGYMDFASEQAPQVKAQIERWFAWHRQTQVPVYIGLLASAQPHVAEPLTPLSTCQWYERIMAALAPALARAVEQAADVLPGVGEEQLRHLEQRYVKVLDEARREYLQPDKEERLAASVKRALDRAEQVYGRLDEPQRKVIADAVAASPFDPEAWLQERRRRQRDTLATARRLIADKAGREQRIAGLASLAERSQHSPDPVYRAYDKKLTEYNCAFVARLHNATTPTQRQRAKATLKGWEDDLRAVVAGPAPAAAADPSRPAN
ncbi:MAG: hypothetical protein JNL85_02195 [Rubrivivax sp.]|nr:hypothetical protein [Rubrivivax sp.]